MLRAEFYHYSKIIAWSGFSYQDKLASFYNGKIVRAGEWLNRHWRLNSTVKQQENNRRITGE